MKTTKLLAAATLLVAATGAFANEFDGVAPDAWVKQTAISQQAPAPTAAASDKVSSQTNQAVTP
jgi:hypothetical protein